MWSLSTACHGNRAARCRLEKQSCIESSLLMEKVQEQELTCSIKNLAGCLRSQLLGTLATYIKLFPLLRLLILFVRCRYTVRESPCSMVSRDFVAIWRQSFTLLQMHLHLCHPDKDTRKACHVLSIHATALSSVSLQGRGARRRNGNSWDEMRSNAVHLRQQI